MSRIGRVAVAWVIDSRLNERTCTSQYLNAVTTIDTLRPILFLVRRNWSRRKSKILDVNADDGSPFEMSSSSSAAAAAVGGTFCCVSAIREEIFDPIVAAGRKIQNFEFHHLSARRERCSVLSSEIFFVVESESSEFVLDGIVILFS